MKSQKQNTELPLNASDQDSPAVDTIKREVLASLFLIHQLNYIFKNKIYTTVIVNRFL